MRNLRELVGGFGKRWKVKSDTPWLWAQWGLPTFLLVCAAALSWYRPPVLEDFQFRIFDSFMRLKPRTYDPEAPVRIIDIDDESLAKIGQWPWPRKTLAKLVRRLGGLGVGVTALDAVFAEADRTSPRLIASELPKTDEFRFFRDRLKQLPDHDEIFAREISRSSIVVGFALTDTANGARPERKAVIMHATALSQDEKDRYLQASDLQMQEGKDVEIREDDPGDYLSDAYRGAVVNIPLIEKAAAGAGGFALSPDRDGVVRRLPLLYKLDGKIYPSLALEALRLGVGARFIKILVSGASRRTDWGRANGIAEIVLGPIPTPEGNGELRIPTTPFGEVGLYDSGPRPERFVAAWRLLDDQAFRGLDRARFEGAIAFLGTSAAGLKDQRATPLNQASPGVEAHAQIAEQVLLREFIRRPVWAELLEAGSVIVLGLIVILLISHSGAAWCALVGVAGIAASFWGSWHAFAKNHLLLDPVTPSLAVLLIYLTSSLIKYLRTEIEKKQIRRAFGRYMSPALIDQLAQDSSKLELGGETREMTLMFSDIRGFTTISEQFDAAGLTRFINAYLTPMTNIVLEHKGTIDKYMGDCIMAFWNAPLDDKDHAKNACRAALKMRVRLLELNEQWARAAERNGRKHIPIHTGIGLNSGPCCVGNMGSDLRQDYSVLGDDVNLASRLEGQSKSYGVEIVIGANTRKLVPGFASVELDLIRVKGKTVPVHIYTLLGGEEVSESDKFKKFSKRHAGMIEAYRAQKWDEAEAAIDGLRRVDFPLDKLYGLYEDRIRACRENPPGKDWDGVFTATTK